MAPAPYGTTSPAAFPLLVATEPDRRTTTPTPAFCFRCRLCGCLFLIAPYCIVLFRVISIPIDFARATPHLARVASARCAARIQRVVMCRKPLPFILSRAWRVLVLVRHCNATYKQPFLVRALARRCVRDYIMAYAADTASSCFGGAAAVHSLGYSVTKPPA